MAIYLGAIRSCWVWFIIITLPWIRPEAPALMSTFILLYGLLSGGEDKVWKKRVLVYCAVYLFSHALLLCMRWMLFSQILPNTYYAKTPSLYLGLMSIYNICIAEPYILIIFIAAIISGVIGKRLNRILTGLGFFWVFIYIFEGGDWMPLGRLLLPAMVFFAVSVGMLPGVSNFGRGIIGKVNIIIFRAIFAALIFYSSLSLNKWADITKSAMATIRYDNASIINMLNKIDIKSIAAIDIGMISFYSDFEILDLAGLMDVIIGHLPGVLLAKDLEPDYIFNQRKPDVIIVRLNKRPDLTERGQLNQFKVDMVQSVAEKKLVSFPEFMSLYDYGFAIFPGYERKPFYGKVVFVRKELKNRLIESNISGVYETKPLDLSKI